MDFSLMSVSPRRPATETLKEVILDTYHVQSFYQHPRVVADIVGLEISSAQQHSSFFSMI
ncbi:hypothetical protein HAX54_048395, partial [Datura stramonium]|nr:hypothetical protein [Datura stramonium]